MKKFGSFFHVCIPWPCNSFRLYFLSPNLGMVLFGFFPSKFVFYRADYTTRKHVNTCGSALSNITVFSAFKRPWKDRLHVKTFSGWGHALGTRAGRNIRALTRIERDGRCNLKDGRVKGIIHYQTIIIIQNSIIVKGINFFIIHMWYSQNSLFFFWNWKIFITI